MCPWFRGLFGFGMCIFLERESKTFPESPQSGMAKNHWPGRSWVVPAWAQSGLSRASDLSCVLICHLALCPGTGHFLLQATRCTIPLPEECVCVREGQGCPLPVRQSLPQSITSLLSFLPALRGASTGRRPSL